MVASFILMERLPANGQLIFKVTLEGNLYRNYYYYYFTLFFLFFLIVSTEYFSYVCMLKTTLTHLHVSEMHYKIAVN